MTIYRNVFLQDRPLARLPARTTRDSLLSAFSSGKLLVTGRTWQGDLRPLIDGYIAAIEPLINGLTSGRVLHADPVPDALRLGRAWVGDLQQRLRDAALESAAASEGAERVNIGDVKVAATQLEEALCGGSSSTADALRNLMRAADAVTRKLGSKTHDNPHPWVRGRSRPHGSASRPVSPAELSAVNARFWAARSRSPTHDTSTTAPRTPD